MQVFGINVTVPDPDFVLGETQAIPGLGYYAKAIYEGQPSALLLKVAPQQGGKTHLIFGPKPQEARETSEAQNSYSRPLTPQTPFTFEVPITWREDGLPSTRREPLDNFRVVTLTPRRGSLASNQLEVGVATREADIYVTAQDQWTGHLIRQGGFIPTQPHHNYPGMPAYSQLWRGIAPKLRDYIREKKIFVPQQGVAAPKWNPPPAPPQDNKFPERGVVLYFSPVAGHGRILSEEGVKIFLKGEKMPSPQFVWFVHFSKIVGDNIGLAPMTWVHCKLEKGRPGQRYTPVAACKPA